MKSYHMYIPLITFYNTSMSFLPRLTGPQKSILVFEENMKLSTQVAKELADMFEGEFTTTLEVLDDIRDRYALAEDERVPLIIHLNIQDIHDQFDSVAVFLSEARPLNLIFVISMADPRLLPEKYNNAFFGAIPNLMFGTVDPTVRQFIAHQEKITVPEDTGKPLFIYRDDNWQLQHMLLDIEV